MIITQAARPHPRHPLQTKSSNAVPLDRKRLQEEVTAVCHGVAFLSQYCELWLAIRRPQSHAQFLECVELDEYCSPYVDRIRRSIGQSVGIGWRAGSGGGVDLGTLESMHLCKQEGHALRAIRVPNKWTWWRMPNCPWDASACVAQASSTNSSCRWGSEVERSRRYPS